MSIFKAYNAVQNVGNSMIDNLEKGATNKLNKIGDSTEPPPPTSTTPTSTTPTTTPPTPSESVTNGGKRIRTRRRKHLRRKTKKHRKQKKQRNK